MCLGSVLVVVGAFSETSTICVGSAIDAVAVAVGSGFVDIVAVSAIKAVTASSESSTMGVGSAIDDVAASFERSTICVDSSIGAIAAFSEISTVCAGARLDSILPRVVQLYSCEVGREKWLVEEKSLNKRGFQTECGTVVKDALE
jgi:hypothetical protein